ncbi:MAG: DUF4290 domain-containing protein [Bacteroidales bacterium]|nr:DUF4290 domain-containing protein [Bacteroidales bacterium]
MDYNTQRKKLILPEYGRCIQEMVDHAKTIEDREERQQCANTIIKLLSNLYGKQSAKEDVTQKLWNHLAAMANYELDIDYPVEIENLFERENKLENIKLPQKKIRKPHYGALAEETTKVLQTMEDGEEKDALIRLVANQMKRNLANWNPNALSDEKILDDLADLTHGKVQLLPNEIDLIPDAEILKDISMSQVKKKKKK